MLDWHSVIPEAELDRKDESRWAWYGKPDREVIGREGRPLRLLQPNDLRLLGKPALRLYCLLERTRGWHKDTFSVDLTKVAEELGMSYRTAKRALARLKECGAVAVTTCTEVHHPREHLPDLFPRFTRLNVYRVFGSWDYRKGLLRVVLPAAEWEAWATDRSGWGGRRRGAGRPPRRNQAGPLSFVNSPQRGLPEPPADGETGTYASKMAHNSINNTIGLHRGFLTHVRNNPVAGATSPPGGLQLMSAEDLPQELAAFDTTSQPRLKLTPRVPQLPRPARSPVPRLSDSTDSTLEQGNIPEWMKVDSLGQAYRAAVRQVYDQPCYVLRNLGKQVEHRSNRPAVGRSRIYSQLRKALPPMIEHLIPPSAWARWYLRLAKEKGWNGGKPPSITQVFAPSTLRKWRSWFFRTHDVKQARIAPTKEHIEQELRIREVDRLNRGHTPEAALCTLPAWYQKIRRQEMAMGYDDPNDFYPEA